MQQNFKLLAWATLANGTCFSMILPLLAPLIRELGLTEVQGGVIVSAGAICMAIASILIARGEKNTDSLSINELWFLGHDHYLGYIYSDSLLGNTTNITRNDSFCFVGDYSPYVKKPIQYRYELSNTF